MSEDRDSFVSKCLPQQDPTLLYYRIQRLEKELYSMQYYLQIIAKDDGTSGETKAKLAKEALNKGLGLLVDELIKAEMT